MIIKNWENPPAGLRSKLFWAWNGQLSEEIIRRQICQMHQMGLGGFYIHSRNGLKTPYLGKEWFECVKCAIDQANAEGIEAALYDEDRWPSGAAGGMVAARNPELTSVSLNCQRGGTAPADTLCTFGSGEDIRYFYTVKSAPREWFNNSTFPDVFNPETARSFLEITHEKYLAECGNFAGVKVKEIFMDEPFFGVESFRFGNGLPWTARLPELYFERFGEDLISGIPGLFIDLPDNSHIKIRWQFFTLISELFRENFLRPISCWCEEHGLQLTGHMLGEDMLGIQAGSHGSNMASLKYFQKPGIDYLTGQRRLPATVKQLTSAARQLGRPERLAEIYGCTGWEFSLYDQRKQGDMLFALGVNRHCLHLGWYSAEGERKRDFPGSLVWHSSAFEACSRLEDRFGRMHAIFEECSEVRDILLLNPVESAFTLLQERYEESFTLDSLENSRHAAIEALLNANLDFDLGDEELFTQYASVKDGRFQVGKAAYQAVIVPETVTLRRTTWELLKEFAAAGGVVCFTGILPGYIDGVKRQDAFEFVTCRPAELPEKLAFCRRVSLADEQGEMAGLLHMLLRHNDGYFLFIHNPGYTLEEQSDATTWRGVPVAGRRHAAAEFSVQIAGCAGVPQFWNMDDGSVTAGKSRFALAAGESKMLFFPDAAQDVPPSREMQKAKVLNDLFPVSLTEPNVLLLDRAEAAVGDGEFHAAMDMRRLDAMIRKINDMSPRMLPRRQPWAEPGCGKTVPVTLRFTFFCDEVPLAPVRFAVEDGNARIFCNGELLEKTEFFWFDDALKFFAVKNLHCGINQIVMHTSIDHHRTLEDCFLLGDFGVDIAGFDLHICAPVRSLRFGDWCRQGLPFYSGAVDCKLQIAPGRNRKLDLDFTGSYAEILECKDNCWHEKDALYLPDEVSEVTLRLYGSRRNSHGPFHVIQQLRYCNPGSFVPLREDFHPHWMLESYGIFPSAEVLEK